MAMIIWLKNGTSSKVYGNIGISKIEFFNFLGLKGLNKIKKKIKPFRTSLRSSSITFQIISTKVNFFIFN